MLEAEANGGAKTTDRRRWGIEAIKMKNMRTAGRKISLSPPFHSTHASAPLYVLRCAPPVVEEVPRVDRRSEAPAEDTAGPHLLDGPSVCQEHVKGRCELVGDQELLKGVKAAVSEGRERAVADELMRYLR